jgi:hypothetical protein
VHLVRAVGEPQAADPGERGGEREVLGQPARAVHLDRLVQDPLHGERGGDLDGLDLGVGGLVALGVHQPRGLEHQQPQLLDRHPRLDARVHRLDGPLGDADRAHPVVDPPRAEAGLRDREAVALPADQVLHRDPDVTEGDLGAPSLTS